MSISLQEQDLYSRLQTEGPQALAALDTVLQRTTTTSAVLLFLASAVAMRSQRLEDGAFLYFIAQMRRRFDENAFPYQGTPSSDPGILMNALSYRIGQAVNPAIMAQPASYQNVVARLEPWEPEVPADYAPGWEYAAPAVLDTARAEHADNKRQTLEVMRGTATLLSDGEYLDNVLQVQNYNLHRSQPLPTEAEYQAALARLKAIESEKRIQGPFTLGAGGN